MFPGRKFAGLSFCMHREQDLYYRISQIFLEFPFVLLYGAKSLQFFKTQLKCRCLLEALPDGPTPFPPGINHTPSFHCVPVVICLPRSHHEMVSGQHCSSFLGTLSSHLCSSNAIPTSTRPNTHTAKTPPLLMLLHASLARRVLLTPSGRPFPTPLFLDSF